MIHERVQVVDSSAGSLEYLLVYSGLRRENIDLLTLTALLDYN